MNAVNMLNWAPRVGICVGSFFERRFFFVGLIFCFLFLLDGSCKRDLYLGIVFARKILMDILFKSLKAKTELWSH